MNALKTAVTKALSVLLPQRVKNSLFHLSFHLAHPEFEKFAYQYSFAPNMRYGLQAIPDRGLSLKTVVDVGAFEGEWSKIVKATWPLSTLIMVEPNTAKIGQLSAL